MRLAAIERKLRERNRRKPGGVRVRIDEQARVLLRIREADLFGDALRQYLVLDLHVPQIGTDRKALDGVPTRTCGPLCRRFRLQAVYAGESVWTSQQVVL